MSVNNKFKSGGVSIFIVVATCLLVAVIVASFIRLINRDQQSASQQDLSQSAYDSSQSGVEDAKRAILEYQKSCQEIGAGDANSDCSKKTAALSKDSANQSCRLLAESFNIGDPNNSETLIQSNTSGNSELNQAYTCVKIDMNTNDFLGEVTSGNSKVIPLKAKDTFNKIRLSWFTEKDADSSDIDLPKKTDNMLNMFSSNAKWPINRPSVMRTQLILPNGNINLTDSESSLDATGATRTAYLYPTSDALVSFGANITPVSFSSTRRQFDGNALTAVKCKDSIADGGYSGYACSAMLNIGQDVSGDSGATMRLSSQYGSITNYKVEMVNGAGSVVQFNGVQPSVDSTGRANDQFRRVQSRLEIGGSQVPIPEFAVSTDGKFCKAMTIRDSTQNSTIECN